MVRAMFCPEMPMTRPLARRRASRLAHPIACAALAAALSALPLAAAAQDSQADRFQALSERMMGLMVAGMIEQQPALDGLLPTSITYDGPTRRASRCTLNGYVDLVGEDGVEAMLAAFETALAEATPAEVISPDFVAGRPEGLTPQEVSRIQTECRLSERQVELLDLASVMQALQSR